MARINREVVSTVIIDASKAREGAAEFDRAAAKVVNASKSAVRIIERQTVMLGEQAKQYARLKREVDPAGVALEKFAAKQKTLERQFKNDKGNPEYIRMLGLLEAKFKTTGDAAATMGKKTATAQEELQRRAQALRESIDPLARAQRLHNEAVREAHELHAADLISYPERSAAINNAAQALRAATEATDDFSNAQRNSARQAARRITQLSPQISDIVTQFASGTSPATILVQQGPQIADIWGGIPTLLSKIPPHVKALTAGMLALGTVTYLTARRFAEISQQARALEAIGKTLNPQIAGMSAELRKMTMAMADDIGRQDAIKSIEAIVRTRQLEASLYQDIFALVPDMSAVLGIEPVQAAIKLADAFSRGANGVRELNSVLDFLTPAQMDQIEATDRANDRLGAMRLALKALAAEYEGRSPEMKSAWTQALTDMGNAWDALWEKVANSGFVTGTMENWAGGIRIIGDLFKNMGSGAESAATSTATATASVAELERRIWDLQAAASAAEDEAFKLLDAGDDRAQDALERAAELTQQLQDAQAKLTAARESSSPGFKPIQRDSRGLTNDESIRVNESRRALDAETAAMVANQVQRQITTAGLRAYEAARARDASEAEATIERLHAEEAARRDLRIAIDDENQALELNISRTRSVAEAYRVSQEAGMQAEAMRQAANDQLTTGVDAADRAMRLLRKSAAEADEQIAKTFNTLRQDTANQNLLAGASRGTVADQQEMQRRIEAENLYRDAIKAAALARDQDGVNALIKERDAYQKTLEQRDAYARTINVAANARRSLEDDVALIEREYELVGASNVERDREISLLQLRRSLINAGYEGQALEDEIDRLREMIGLRAVLDEKTRRAQEEFERGREAIMSSVDIMRDGFEDLVTGAESFTDVIRDMSKAFLQLGMDVVVMAPLRNMLNDLVSGGSGMTPGSYSPAQGPGIWGALGSLVQGGLNAYGGWSAGTGASLMPNAATDAGALSAGALLQNWKMYPVAHKGWHVGETAPPEMRVAPSSVFVGAPRLHNGGMRPGEFPAILERGEEVLTARNPRHRNNYRGGAPTIVMNITTPDANSFRQSQGQISASAARSLALANRRFG